MSSDDLPDRLLGAVLHTADGRPVGPVTGMYLDADTGEAAWVAVRLGMGVGESAEHLVPLARTALRAGCGLVVTTRRRAIELAPTAPPGDLGAADEDTLYRYYAYALSPLDHLLRVRRDLTGCGPERARLCRYQPDQDMKREEE